ncbi:MAG TPA: FG-GAP-like repeat-containing protein [Pyrinomonadaceae bacterium]|nr:FG-GAP-like repeat-containing protein [Pyrinomonadaceae bacterium]
MKHLKLFIIAIFLIGLTSLQGQAATFTVTNTNDSGAGSLRQAILDANVNKEDDVIEFDSTVFSTPRKIVLTSGQLVIEPDNVGGTAKLLTIKGTGADMLTLSGNNQSRVITIDRDAGLILSGIKITEGNGIGGTDYFGAGGGILVKGGSPGPGLNNLILTDSIISENNVITYNSSGGGLFIDGRATIINTTVSNNSSPSYGGGISTYSVSEVRIFNSTISKNFVTAEGVNSGIGGAIMVGSGAKLYLTNCTVAFNRTNKGTAGGGIFLQEYLNNYSYLYSRNSIIAKNLAGETPSDIWGRLVSEGFNIIGIAPGASGAEGDQLNADPQLDPELKLNGGIIPTHALSAGSPAIDNGSNCVLTSTESGGCLDTPITTDLRGVKRPQDGDKDGIAIVDIGSFEVTPAEVEKAPAKPDLRAEDDTGVSDTDNITMSRNLNFTVGSLIEGATVEFYRNGDLIGSKTVTGTSATFTDTDLSSEGTFSYTARQVFNDGASLNSAALRVVVDNTAPAVKVEQASGQADPVKTEPLNFTAVFNETVVGFSASDVSLDGSTADVSAANISVTGNSPNYSISVSNVKSDGAVRASVAAGAAQDLAGNSSLASTSADNTVTLDTTSPTVTINRAAAQADPTRNTPVNFTVVFSEPVTGFTNSDVSLAGSTINVSSASITVSGSGSTYNVAIGNFTSNGGFIMASVPANAANDAAGNPSLASTGADNKITVDNVGPTVTINQAAGQIDPTITTPVNFTVVFNEAVTGFDSSDITLTGSTANISTATIAISGSGTTYNVSVGNITSNGHFVRAAVRAGAVTDAIGNLSQSSTSSDNTITIDNVPPSVTINKASGQAEPVSNQPVNFQVVFSEPVTGFTSFDVSLAGSTANVSLAKITVTGSGAVYNVAVSNITSSGLVRASIPAGGAQDLRGNLNLASTSASNTISVYVKRAAADFDGDGRTDYSIFRPSAAEWWYMRSSDGNDRAFQFGLSTDKIIPADYTGDGKTDIAFFRPSTNEWFVLRSEDFSFYSAPFGAEGDIPSPADFDGDGKTDLAVFRPSNGHWYILLSKGGTIIQQFGRDGDIPASGDFDGDGKADLAIYRPDAGEWWILRSSDGANRAFQFGTAEDKPVPGDYTGDRKTDIAFYRPSKSEWFVLRSEDNSFYSAPFGAPGDIPVPGDYDGDLKDDFAVWRPANSNWYVVKSTGGFSISAFGSAGDKPVPNAFIP